jgi:hypothetical protein
VGEKMDMVFSDSVQCRGRFRILERPAGSNLPWEKADVIVDKENMIVDAGKNLIRDLINGTETSAYLQSFAFGTGNTAPVAGNTGLQTPVAYSGSNIYKVFEEFTPGSKNTLFVGYWSSLEPVTMPVDITEVGLFTGSLTTAGTMYCRQTFTARTKTTSLEWRLEYTLSWA